jgi:hypothetical protein
MVLYLFEIYDIQKIYLYMCILGWPSGAGTSAWGTYWLNNFNNIANICYMLLNTPYVFKT